MRLGALGMKDLPRDEQAAAGGKHRSRSNQQDVGSTNHGRYALIKNPSQGYAVGRSESHEG